MVDAREYHDRTAHTPQSVRTSTPTMDPDNKPRPYKIYEDLHRVSPAGPTDPPDVPALSAVAHTGPDSAPDAPAGSPDLHTLCQYAAGVTKEIERHGRRMRFRAASCTGKLYHVDLYAVTGDCGPAGPGVYHFDPDSGEYDVLREGDYQGVLAAATGGGTGAGDASVTFVLTSEWWRNAWKYGARTYRHAFWDSGTVLANLLAAAGGAGHRAEAVAAFADGPVVGLLGLDPEAEAPLELVPVGTGDPAPDPLDVTSIDPDEAPLSDRVEEYPLVPDAWEQSTLGDGAAARAWREGAREAIPVGRRGPGDGERVELDPVDEETASARPVGATIERRGSLREYSREPVSARMFATVLDRALRGAPTDCTAGRAPGGLVDCYCLVHAVEGISSGAYQYHPGETALERVGDTDRETAAHLALDQSVVGDTAVNVYLMADVEAVIERLGNRGYRLAQLEGGIALGRLYLATYAHLALGGRGFTFYDDRVRQHLAPRAGDQQPMTMFAFGRPDADA